MKQSKLRLFAAAAALSLVLNNIGIASYALDASHKEEVIYVNITNSGEVDNIDVVNILTPDSNGEVVDYGDYTSVRNMTTTDTLNYKNQELNAKTTAAKIYYDGHATNMATPWTISIKYFINNQEVNPNVLVGKSGALRINVKVDRNNNYTGPDFFKNYALQGTIKLDSEKCKNIVSDKATIANVGQQKQLSYIALPNKGFDFDITADVVDFEYDGVAINAIPLNLNVKIDDSKLMSQVNELQDAIVKVDDGAQALNGGLESLHNGLNQARGMLGQINTADLQTALAKAQLALDNATLINESGAKLIAASAQIKTAISTIASGANQLKNSITTNTLDTLYTNNGININNISTQNANTIASLQQQIASLNSQIEQLQQLGGQDAAIAQIQAQVQQLSNIVALIDGNNKTLNGADQITRGFINNANKNISDLAAGANKLEAKYNEFDQGLNTFVEALSQLSTLANSIQGVVNNFKGKLGNDPIAKVVAGYNAIVNGATRLFDGSQQLANGTSQLRDATSTLDSKVTNEIDSLLASIKGEAHIGSFTSSKNTHVDAVQFVIKSDAIKKTALKVEHQAVETEQKNFFEKFFALFH